MNLLLRPFRADEFDLVWAAKRASSGWADGNARRRLRRRFERSGELHQGLLELAVEVDGRVVGDVQARRPRHGLPEGVFELGIDLFDPADRGKGIGRAAIAELTSLLFRDYGAGRVQASTAVDNVAARGALEALGFANEGVMRAFMPSPDGARVDYVLYAVTADDWRRR